ncbi:MAG TPA: transcriptional repressor NrdR, partial [Hyphomicrobium zavarzinii]|nr:transcriptional repressor NrdR [Hyphomicrobium zavarzinii]
MVHKRASVRDNAHPACYTTEARTRGAFRMRCPFCGSEDSQVKDSRPSDENSAIRRRRICSDCGGRFTTFERVQLRELTVVKRSGRKVLFDRDKLSKSISVA